MDGLDDTGTARWLSEIRDPRIEGMDGDVSSSCRYTFWDEWANQEGQ